MLYFVNSEKLWKKATSNVYCTIYDADHTPAVTSQDECQQLCSSDSVIDNTGTGGTCDSANANLASCKCAGYAYNAEPSWSNSRCDLCVAVGNSDLTSSSTGWHLYQKPGKANLYFLHGMSS